MKPSGFNISSATQNDGVVNDSDKKVPDPIKVPDKYYNSKCYSKLTKVQNNALCNKRKVRNGGHY